MGNPLQIAIGRWYRIGLGGENKVAVGVHPAALAFDGESVWVANTGSNKITKIRAHDCTAEGTFAVTGMPVALAFDGGSVWVLTRDATATRLLRLKASTGHVTATHVIPKPGPTPVDAVDLVFDGKSLWVGWSGVGESSVTRVKMSNGAVLATVATQVGYISGMTFDGSNVCVASIDSEGVSRIRASDAVVLGVTPAPANAITFDGEYLWAAGWPLFGTHSVVKIRASDGAVVGSFFPKVGGLAITALAIAFDGACIWVAEQGRLRQLQPSDGAQLGAWKLPGSFHAIAFDGANVWLADYGGNAVVKV